MTLCRKISLAAILLLVSALLSACQKPLPNPIASFPFEVSKKGAVVEAEFTIPMYRSWIFGVTLLQRDKKEAEILTNFPGFDRFSKIEPGRAKLLPVDLTISEFNPQTRDFRPIFSEQAPTVTPYLCGLGQCTGLLFSINLHPGLYRLTATTDIDNPLLAGIQSFITIWYRAYVGTWPSAINPKRLN